MFSSRLRLSKRTVVLALLVFSLNGCGDDKKDTQSTDYSNWDQVVSAASGQTVYWNAWGGSDQINRYIDWVGSELKAGYNIELKQVKVDDIALSINRVLAEFSAGKKTTGGSIDLMWINGENFRSMKENNLLFGPFTEYLPNYPLVDTVNKPTTLVDFGTPVDGMEAPWGSAQLVFINDRARVPNPPKNIIEMLEHGRENPGRITYPKPPNFIGTTFLKQALYQFIEDPRILQQSVSQVNFSEQTAALWRFLDEFHQYAWNQGNSFPNNGPDQIRLLNDNEIDFAMAFNPAEASAAIIEGLLPKTARTFVFDNGSIGNSHFVAIPANSSSKEAALVTANFLMSAQAQLRKQNPQYWGDFTVLDTNRLTAEMQTEFANLSLGVATLSPAELGSILPEPHSSWTDAIEKAWQQRYLR